MEAIESGINTFDLLLRERIISDLRDGYPFSEVLITLSENLLLRGDYNGARRLLNILLMRDLSSEGKFLEGRIHKLLGDIEFTQGNLDRAGEEYLLSKQLLGEYPAALNRIYLDLGNIAMQKGEWSEMEKYYDLAEAGIQDGENDGFLADIEINRGISHSIRGDDAEALRRFERAMALISSDDQGRLASCFLDMSISQMELGDLKESMESIRKALGYAKAIGDIDLETTIYINRVKLSLLLCDYMVAQFYAEKAFELAERVKNDFSKAEILKLFGVIADKEGDREGAIAKLDEAVALSKKTGNASTLVESLIELGTIYLDDGDADRAVKIIDEAKKKAEEHHLMKYIDRISNLSKKSKR